MIDNDGNDKISIAACKPKRKPSRINKFLSMAFNVYFDKFLHDKATTVVKAIITMTMITAIIPMRKRITIMNNLLYF